MSAGVCGKRVGFEEIFGSSPKRFRCSSFESPNPSSDSESRPDDPASTMLQMFPSFDPELITTTLRNHNNKIEDLRESLNALSSDLEERNKPPHSFDYARTGNCTDIPVHGTATCSQMSEQNVEDVDNIKQKFDNGTTVDSPKWVDLFVHEMMSATNINDARGRAARILEAFEGSITANKRVAEEMEYASLKEHLQSLLDKNQILRKAVAIQHERNLEQEGKEREVQHLKLTLSQYLEQVRTLELNNYTLRLHLQRAQESSSLQGQFPHDIH
ncbi:uncharacterized protein LOC111293871 isoform X2 [Durio zibethinus]|uniref:Uncharacterized protein LOC111293871 isoform X2 n=1 Tax=Durio zibethinus TaxID=66656 RepID=A0A6P5YR93_DURZI|nr:uncharacterized protein LOC111293871 isoform X2 [Durio zibethinus]